MFRINRPILQQAQNDLGFIPVIHNEVQYGESLRPV